MSKFRDPAEVVLELIRERVGAPDKIGLDTKLDDELDLDSLDLVEIELELEDEYAGVRFDEDIVFGDTVQSAIDKVKAKLAAAKL